MPDAELRLRDSVTAWAGTDDEAVLLDLANARYLGLNHSAALLWSMLLAGTTRAELIARLVTEFGLTDEKAAHDVDDFVAQCAERGYLDR